MATSKITDYEVPQFSRMEQGDPTEDPERLLHGDLFPDDLYKGSTYWADLPYTERVQWVNAQSNAEARRELKLLGQEIKKDPLKPINDYFRIYVITGFVRRRLHSLLRGLCQEFVSGRLAVMLEDIQDLHFQFNCRN